MILNPLADAFDRVADNAGKRGIPTLSLQTTTSSKYAINIQGNSYGNGALGSSVAFRQIGGKGNVLYVHGISTAQPDQDVFAGYRNALKNCPGIKQAGEIAGGFVANTAKAQTLRFLGTHPEPIDAVMQTGGMASGIISAFEQAGRPVPPVNDIGGMKGALGYWRNNESSYTGFSQPYPTVDMGNAVVSIAKRMLAGRGIKISDVTARYPTVTLENLDDWAEPGWDLTTPGSANGPPGSFLPESYLNGLFENPAPVK
jgi:ribose transport system substrate-binding protein